MLDVTFMVAHHAMILPRFPCSDLWTSVCIAESVKTNRTQYQLSFGHFAFASLIASWSLRAERKSVWPRCAWHDQLQHRQPAGHQQQQQPQQHLQRTRRPLHLGPLHLPHWKGHREWVDHLLPFTLEPLNMAAVTNLATQSSAKMLNTDCGVPAACTPITLAPSAAAARINREAKACGQGSFIISWLGASASCI